MNQENLMIGLQLVVKDGDNFVVVEVLKCNEDGSFLCRNTEGYAPWLVQLTDISQIIKPWESEFKHEGFVHTARPKRRYRNFTLDNYERYLTIAEQTLPIVRQMLEQIRVQDELEFKRRQELEIEDDE